MYISPVWLCLSLSRGLLYDIVVGKYAKSVICSMKFLPKKKTLGKVCKIFLVGLLLLGMIFFVIAPFFTAFQGGAY